MSEHVTSGHVSFQVTISGRVQGVGYRYSTQQQAISLGIVGWVRNLPSGQVEALIVGRPSGIDSLLDWFQTGPPAAAVTAVETEQKDPAALEPAVLESFEIRR